ncbi:MAG: Tol-Pal system beta propeller repeat protein TolB [Oligoflexia bacterium]|nr:Tol-Pal system beta propeller repeat protein TolB [Oligoflexia bacterium]
MKSVLFFGLSVLVSFSISYKSYADEPLIKIAVGEARTKKSIVAFPIITASNDGTGTLRSTREIVMEDLSFSGLFDFLSPSAFIENPSTSGITLGSFKMSNWTTIGADFLIKAKGSISGDRIDMELFLYATQSGRQILAKRYKSSVSAARKMAHTISNDVLFALTGKKGPFTSKIAFVSDKTGKKEIYVMDYDGYNPVKVTSRFSHAMAPAWKPDGSEIVFTAITKNNKNVRNHNLFIYNLKSGKIRMISNRAGINSGAAFSPNGQKLALTMSFPGNPEIFLMDPDSKVVQRITNSYGLDVDPAWSHDGKKIAFVSDRPGRPMVYTMDSTGANIQRLTYAGYYNATPTWSPLGNKIAFAGWDAGKFDIFIMDPNGTNIERLTKNMGNNEDPDFAPDGYFLVYSSNRKGKKNLYITNTDNTVHRQITSDFGNCEAPKWSPTE